MGKNAEKSSKIAARIGVLCGGMSNERAVSLRSGKKVFEALQRSGYKNTILIDVDENIAATLKREKIEIAFNVLHGKYGEDGCIQGLLDIMKIPYTGCGVKSSAICMDKNFTKEILKSHGIPVIKSVCISDSSELKLTEVLKYPLMVKPVQEGSSIGMTKVDAPEELEAAFFEAKKSDDKILIEEYLQGESATVGVLEDAEGKPFATPVLGFKTKTLWYDYEAKYTEGMTEFILPAAFDAKLTEKIQKIAVDAHKICECSGVSRVDFLVYDNIPYVLEINTSPGMTDLSDLPAQANAMGINYETLVENLLNTAKLNK
jgi:D-alanine-D-alanine ligase